MAIGDGNRLPGLDALRGLAATGVIVHHLEQSRSFYGLSNYWGNIGIFRLGGLSVTFFFVLSGFLITYLLMEEDEKNGHIQVGKFYMRRVLRIWPLYFFLTVLSFFLIPYVSFLAIPGQSPDIADFWPKLGLFAALSAHLATTFYEPVPYAAVLWSVGVEEWFYLLWPLVFLIHPKARIVVVLGIIPFLIVFRREFKEGYLFYFLSQLRFDAIAIGALAAMFYRNRAIPRLGRLLHAVSSESIWTLAVLLLCFLMTVGRGFGPLNELIYSSLFALIIMGAVHERRGKALLNNRILNSMGKISYGAYCFNWITLVVSLKLLNWFALPHNSISHLLNYVVGFGLTFGLAAASYYWFERPFLSIKNRAYGTQGVSERGAGAVLAT